MADMKAAHIIHSLAPGGAERVVCHLAAGLREFHIDSEVFCLGEGGIYQDALQEKGIPVWGLGKKSKWGGLLVTLKLAGLLKRRKVTVVHAHSFSAALYGRIAASLARTPVRIVSFHGSQPHGKLKKIFNQILYPGTHKIIAVSEFVLQGLRRQYPGWDLKKLGLIYNGLDPQHSCVLSREEKRKQKESLGMDPEKVVIGTVASLTPVKNHNMLLDASAKALVKNNALLFLLVGGGPLAKALKEQAEDLGISENVIFAGIQKNIFHYLNAMDLFVLSSWNEGLPMSLLEAMACGLPVVATAVGGIPEAVTHGETGYLCRKGDSTDLAEKILAAVSRKERLEDWGNRAISRVNEVFSLEGMCRKTADLYREAYEEIIRE